MKSLKVIEATFCDSIKRALQGKEEEEERCEEPTKMKMERITH